MKVSHFNTYLNGGAAVAARRLHDSLVKEGVKSHFYTSERSALDESYLQLEQHAKKSYLPRFLDVYQRRKFLHAEKRRQSFLSDRPSWLELFSFPERLLPFSGGLSPFPDVVHLHWIANFIDYPSFFKTIPDETPIVWTLHDMNPFTGGCHYSWNCSSFKNECGNCFQLGNPSVSDVSHENIVLKYECLKNKNLHVVADSHWLEEEARSSFVFSNAKSFQTIHYGLDHLKFTPRSKSTCREALGIGTDKFVIAFGAVGVENRRKGIVELISALEILGRKDVLLLLFGSGKLDSRLGNLNVVSLGNVDSELLLSAVYSAADLFVIPSLYEAFGQTSLEAMACGTPVVGFDTGGIPDMVENYQTGLLAARGNSEDLANKIEYMLDHPSECEQMGINARRLVEESFKLRDQASCYLNLYEKLLSIMSK